MKLAGLLPSRKEALGGVLWGAVAFALLLGLAWNKGHNAPAPATPTAIGSLLLSTDDKATASRPSIMAPMPARPMPANWESNTEIVDGKRLPTVTAQGERVFDLYRRPPAAATGGKPKIAFMAYGLGFDAEATRAALAAMAPETGLAIMPNAPYADRLQQLVRGERREVWVHLPSENRNASINEGGHALRTNTPPQGNIAYLNEALNAMRDYTGVTFSAGSALTASPNDMAPLIAALGARGLGIATANVMPALDQMKAAEAAKAPYLATAIDATASPMPDAIRARLDNALAGAQNGGSAFVIITRVNDRTLAVINEWISLHRNAFSLVPPSALTD